MVTYLSCILRFCYRVTFGFSIQGSANLVRDTNCWQREHEWRQDIAVVTKWLSGVSPVSSFLSSTFQIKYSLVF